MCLKRLPSWRRKTSLFSSRRSPGFSLFLGVANPAEGWTDYVHTPTFRPDEEAIATGVTAVASLLADYTARRQSE